MTGLRCDVINTEAMKNLLVDALASAPRGTQTRIADEMGIRPQTVNKWRKGYNLPEPDRWTQLEHLLGLDDGAISRAAGITQPPDDAQSTEELRAELRRLDGEMRSLRAELDELRAAAVRPPRASSTPRAEAGPSRPRTP